MLRGTVTIGILVAFIQYSQRFWRPIQDLSRQIQHPAGRHGRQRARLQTPRHSGRNHYARATPCPARAPAASSSATSGSPTSASRPEQLTTIAAASPEDLEAIGVEWILRGVSFTIEPNETAAIVGHTGAGKTTIISLMMRFYDVQRGQVLIDGIDVRAARSHRLRQHFGVVLQDPFLFTGTIAENIRLGTKSISDADMERAADEVNVLDFIRTLPHGFNEPLRERGAALSTGQKQLINFARALAHRPRILILDEATSSVDTDTEIRVRTALDRMVTGRTSVVIAHRLSTVQRADTILVMHKGQLREHGPHQQLLAQHGIYWKLYRLQYKDQEMEATSQIASTPLALGTD